MKTVIQLTRISMSSAIAFSAVAGYIFFAGKFDVKIFAVFLGVFFMACAATILNQIQERHRDAMMERTRNRPLPSGRIKSSMAILLTILLALAGSLVLYYFTNPLTCLLGLINMAWYNSVYTPLKKVTGFVVIIGAVTGALPPIMGWTAAGGHLADPKILFIAMFFFLWQIPHFLLLLLRFKTDYERAGFKAVTGSMNDNQIKTVVFFWILSTSIITLLFPVFGIISGGWFIAAIIVVNVYIIINYYRCVFNRELKFNIGKAFGSLYVYQLSVLALLIFQALKQ
jgi:protoheme IX farnesyltransferase